MMKSKNFVFRLGAAIMVALFVVSCKPTEQNYRAAYDAAREKREAAMREQMMPATGLLSDDGPQLRVIDGDSVYVLQENVWEIDSKPARRLMGWHVAVGVYKMDTNAKANAASLKEAGYKGARAAKALDNRYYTLITTVQTLDSARAAAADFRRSHRSYPYVGLPAAPVLLH